MSFWISLQIIFLVIWIIAAFAFIQLRAWKISSPFSINLGFWLTMRFAFLGWLITSIVLGIVYLLLELPKTNMYATVISLLIFPLLLISIFLFKNWYVEHASNANDNRLRNKINQCKQWVQSFPFINNEMIEIKIYLSNGEPTGRLIIHDLNPSQMQEVDKKREQLPKDIHLVMIPKDTTEGSQKFH